MGLNVTNTQKHLVGLFSTPSLQLGYDPDRKPEDVNPMTVPFERDSNYTFISGETMLVKQKSVGNLDGNKMNLDVEFDGDLPKVESEDVYIEPLNTELVASDEKNLIGRGNSLLTFGAKRKIPFRYSFINVYLLLFSV